MTGSCSLWCGHVLQRTGPFNTNMFSTSQPSLPAPGTLDSQALPLGLSILTSVSLCSLLLP